MISLRLGVLVYLGVQVFVFGVLGGILVGVILVCYKNDKVDGILSVIVMLGIFMFLFIIGILLLDYFGFKWNLLFLLGWGIFF